MEPSPYESKTVSFELVVQGHSTKRSKVRIIKYTLNTSSNLLFERPFLLSRIATPQQPKSGIS